MKEEKARNRPMHKEFGHKASKTEKLNNSWPNFDKRGFILDIMIILPQDEECPVRSGIGKF